MRCETCPVDPDLNCIAHENEHGPLPQRVERLCILANPSASRRHDYYSLLIELSKSESGRTAAATRKKIEGCQYRGEVVDKVTTGCGCVETRRCQLPKLERVVGYRDCEKCVAQTSDGYTEASTTQAGN